MRKTLIATLALAMIGSAGSAGAQTVVSADVTVDTTWSGTTILTAPIFVTSGAILTILPGTIVRGQPRTAAPASGVTAGTPGAIVVSNSGTINAVGTPASPIIMTTAAVDRDGDNEADRAVSGFLEPWTAGDGLTNFHDDDPMGEPLSPLDPAGRANVQMWGGLVVTGTAPTNLSDVQGLGEGVATVEGLTVPGFPAANARYGGQDVFDSSGKLSYISVRHAGDEIGAANELNGITLAGVGSGTQIDHLEVYANQDDGIEWFGGTANGSYLAVIMVGDDSFDIDQGYAGINQFLLNISPFSTTRGDFNPADPSSPDDYGSDSGDKVGEWDGDDCPSCQLDSEGFADPISSAAFYNITSFGTSANADTTGGTPEYTDAFTNAGETAFNMRADVGVRLANSIITNSASGCSLGSALNVELLSNTFVDVGAGGCDSATELAGNAIALDTIGGSSPLTNNCSAVAAGPSTTPAAFSGFANEDTTFDPAGATDLGGGGAVVAGKLTPALKSAVIDPRPAGFLCTNGATQNFGQGSVNVTYRGAFDPAAVELWTTDWTVLNLAGLFSD